MRGERKVPGSVDEDDKEKPYRPKRKIEKVII